MLKNFYSLRYVLFSLVFLNGEFGRVSVQFPSMILNALDLIPSVSRVMCSVERSNMYVRVSDHFDELDVDYHEMKTNE